MRASPPATRALVALAIVFASITTAQADPACNLQIEFSVQGRPVIAQALTVSFGESNELLVDKSDQTGAWQLRIVADAPTLIRRVNTIPVDVEIYEITAGQSVLRAAPHIGAVPGQQADMQMIFGNDDGRSARIRVVANVVARPDSPAVDPPSEAQR